MSDGLFAGLPESQQPIVGDVEVIPHDPVIRFLNRWAFNWRGERAVIEKELRELVRTMLHKEQA
jgi:hypothetical protein